MVVGDAYETPQVYDFIAFMGAQTLPYWSSAPICSHVTLTLHSSYTTAAV